jgi:hypothetical protein
MAGTITYPSSFGDAMFDIRPSGNSHITWSLHVDEARELAGLLELLEGNRRAEEMAFDLRQGTQRAVSHSAQK